jgi:hypothetical protein
VVSGSKVHVVKIRAKRIFAYVYVVRIRIPIRNVKSVASVNRTVPMITAAVCIP